MTNKTAFVGTMTRYRRLTWKDRLFESKAIIVFFVAALMFGLVSGVIAPLLFSVTVSGAYSFFPLFFFGGLAGSLGIVFTVRLVDRKIFGVVKSGVLAVEDRVIAGNSKTQLEDLQKLVAGYLKLKRMEAADFYSKKLLELSKSGGTEIAKLSDWMVTTECWVSTEEYRRGWNYRLIWLFETRGVLTFSPHKLDFQSKKLSFSCDPSHIVSLEIKRHPLWLKPIPFRYISLTINEGGTNHTFNLTPSFGQTDTVFDCNKLVDVWYQRLRQANPSLYEMVHGSHGRTTIAAASTAGKIPDWMKQIDR